MKNRIISICPSNTEILYYLGIRDQVIGLDDYSDWPEAWSHLPRLGPDLDIDIDKMKKLKPDLVVASLSVPGMEKNIERLEKEGIPHIVLNPSSIWDIAKDLVTCARALDIEEKGIEISRQYLAELKKIELNAPKQTSPTRLYWEWWPKPVFTPGKKNWLTDVSQLVGATNIFADIDQASVQTTWKEVADRNPDLTCIVWTGIPTQRIKKSLIMTREEWHGKSFSMESNIHILEEGWYCRPSPRLLKGIQHLASILQNIR